MTDKKLLLEKILAAKNHVGAAESELEELMNELRPVLRAEKITVSEVMEGAFSKLREAKSGVLELEKLLAALDD